MTKRYRLALGALATLCLCVVLPELVGQSQVGACVTLLQQERLNPAATCARGVIAKDPKNALAYEIVGAVLLQEKEYAGSVRMLRESVRLEPGLVGARLDLANALALKGEFSEAEVVSREVLRMEPDNFGAAFNVVRLENAQGHYQLSWDAAQTMLPELRGRADGLTVLISDALELEKTDELAGFLKDWSALDHPTVEESVALAELLQARQKTGEAIGVLAGAEQEDATQFDVHFLLGKLYAESGVLESARDEYEAALGIRSTCAHCLLELARLAHDKGQIDGAHDLLIRAQALDGNDVEILTALGKVCLEMDLHDEAIRFLVPAVKLRPDSDSTLYLLASAYTSNKDYGRSLPILRQLETRHPADALFAYSIGAVLYLSSDYKGAEAELRKSLSLDPKGIGALYYLGLTLRREEKFDQAEEVLGELRSVDPNHAAGAEALGELLFTQHQYDKARAVLEQAVLLDGKSRNAHYLLGRTLARLGLREESQAQFAIVGSIDQQN